MSQRMKFTTALLCGLALAAVLGTAGGAQEEGDYVYEVRGFSTQHPTVERVWSEPYDTEAAADARLKELKRDYGKDGLLEAAPDKPLGIKVVKRLRGGVEEKKKGEDKKDKAKDAMDKADKVKGAKDAVNKAKEIKKDGLTAKERQPGDTIREYANRIKDVYQNAVNAKTKLTNLTGSITQKQFKDVNNLIDGFNRSRDDFSKKAGPDGGPTLALYPKVAPVAPRDLKGKLEADPPAGKWVVWVYQLQDGQWVKQDDQSFASDDPDAAQAYLDRAKGRPGFTATSNLPAKTPAIDLVGTWTAQEGESRLTYEFNKDGTFYLSIKNPYFGQGKNGLWSRDGDTINARFVNSGRPGTGGFSKGAPVRLEILPGRQIRINGTVATRK